MAKFKEYKFYGILFLGLLVSVGALFIFFINGPGGQIVLSSIPFIPSFSHTLQLPGNLGQTNAKQISISSDGQKYPLNVTIAQTQQEREKGLMNVTSLPDDSGMLFVFTDNPPIVQNFWMKDTKIPLDMIFFNNARQVVYIEHSAQPCTADPCTVYSSQFPTQYVVETNAGWALNHNIQPGDVLNLSS